MAPWNASEMLTKSSSEKISSAFHSTPICRRQQVGLEFDLRSSKRPREGRRLGLQKGRHNQRQPLVV